MDLHIYCTECLKNTLHSCMLRYIWLWFQRVKMQMFTQMRVNPTSIPLHTYCLFLDIFCVSMPGPIAVLSSLPSSSSLQYWYGNIGTLPLSSDLSHRPHSWGTTSKSSNSWYVLAISVCSRSLCLYLSYTHTHTRCTHANGAWVHEEEVGFSFKSSLFVLSSSSGKLGPRASE